MPVESLTKTVVDKCEEMLLERVAPIAVDNAKKAKYYCGIDCGSTQTRSVLMPQWMAGKDDSDISEWFESAIVIPSVAKAAGAGVALKPKSEALYDNLDSLFTINGCDEIRLVRGSKLNDVESAQKELVASTKKVTSETMLYNIVDAIGYNLVLSCGRAGISLPGKVELELAIALPPDDMLERDLQVFQSAVKRFLWKMTAKMTDVIEVTVVNTAAYSEPAAQMLSYYTFADEEMPEEALLLESGGRNSAPVIFMNGAPVGNGLRSIEQSGSMLLDKIAMAYVDKYGGKLPNRRLVEQAVRSGRMKYGNEYRDVVPLIRRCKDEVADDLFQKLQSDVLSKQSAVSLDSLNVILLSGRVYQDGEYGYSVADRLKKLISAQSPATEVKIVAENRIPQGVVLLYLLDYVFAE